MGVCLVKKNKALQIRVGGRNVGTIVSLGRV